MRERHGYLVTGIFASAQSAAVAARALREAGFGRSQLGPVSPEDSSKVVLAAVRRGFLVGALLGALLGIAFEATMLALPGRGPYGSGGWLAAAAVGAIAGALAAALVRMGVARMALERTRRRFAQAVALSVRVRDRLVLERARSVMRRVGAVETRTPIDDEKQEFARGLAKVAPRLRDRWRARYANSGARWEDHERRYRFGWQIANRPDFAERAWSDAESDVGREWDRRHPAVSWGDVHEQVADGWRTARAAEED